MSWCSVRPSRNATRVRFRLADSVALRIASGTSRALPWPNPTRPFWSPITTSAAKPKRLPPLTTFATRLMWTSLSTNSLSRSSRSLDRSRPPRSRSAAMVFSNLSEAKASVLVSVQTNCFLIEHDLFGNPLHTFPDHALEAQSALARRIRKRLDAAVIEIAAAIEHHFLDAVLHRALGEQLAHRLCRVDVGTGLLAHVLFQRRGGRQRLALQIVDHLRIDVLRRAEHGQPRPPTARAAERQPDALLAPGIGNLVSRHGPLRYFFLPSLRKMNSSTYFTPLPL